MFHFIKKFSIPTFSSLHVYFDLGTSYTRVAIQDKGIVLREPTIIGMNIKEREYVFFGHEAKAIMGKVPQFIKIERPIVNSIISEFDAEYSLLQNYFHKATSPYIRNYPLLKPGFDAASVVPAAATEIEQKAVEEVLYKLGASKVFLFEKAIATAIGCGLNVFAHKPVFIVDLGGGLVEISVISGGGIVTQKTIKNAGEHMNKLIYNYLYLKHGIILGEATCEDLKTKLLNFVNKEDSLMVRGKSLENGLPKSVRVKSSDVKEALLSNINQILDGIKEVVELSPPEVVDELYDQGIILTGGISNSPGINEFFSQELQLNIKLAENKDTSTISGLLRIGRRKDTIERLKIQLP